MKKIIISLIFLLKTASASCEEWTKTDSLLQAAVIASLYIDARQSEVAARDPENYYEKNILLGEHPSVNEVRTYFIGAALIHTGISYLLPTPYRRYWQSITLAIEAGYIASNIMVGVRF